MHSPYATTISDLGTALRLSTLVTPRKSPVLDAIDEAIRECRRECRSTVSTDRFNDHDEALSKLHEARALIAGERT
jgi:hypothetical protein